MERILLASDCTIYPIDSKTDLSSFQCGDSDLDDFFKNDAYLYSKQLLGKKLHRSNEFRITKNCMCIHTSE